MERNASGPLGYAFAGALAGGRTSAAPTFVCNELRKRNVTPRGALVRVMQSSACSTALKVSTVAETVADKLPGIGSRTLPLPLALRTVSGAVSGAALASADRRSAFLGALLGGAGAFVGTFATAWARSKLRRTLRLPDAVAGLAEDAAIYGLRKLS